MTLLARMVLFFVASPRALAGDGGIPGGRGIMGFYMIQGSYTQTAIKHLAQHPENRSKAGEALVKALGGKLHQYFMGFGEHDFVTIVELPDDRADAATSMTLGGAGH